MNMRDIGRRLGQEEIAIPLVATTSWPLDVEIWAVQASLRSDDAARALRAMCDAAELDRASTFRAPSRQRQYVMTRGVLRALIGARLDLRPADVPLRRDHRGKPHVAGAADGLHFSVSYSTGLSLIALARGQEVGIDIEYVNREVDVDAIIRRFFPADEARRLSATPPTQRRMDFFRSWTRKEAWLKAVGEGFHRPLGSVPDLAGSQIVDLVPSPGFRAAVAVTTRGTVCDESQLSERGQ